jgi:drug/metabolite transporter (DMT)-like permease
MRATDRPLLGIAFANGGLVVMALNDALIGDLAQTYSPLQIGFIRLLVMTVAIGVVMIALMRPRLFVTRRFGLLAVRGVLSAISTVAFFYSLQHLSLANVYTVALMSPLIVACLSGWILGESVHFVRWLTIIVGFAGVLVAMAPTAGIVDTWVILAIVSAGAYALAMMLNRVLTRTEDSLTIVFYMSIVGAVVLAPFALPAWQAIDSGDVALLLAVGLQASVVHVLMVQAYRYAPAHTVITFDYVSVFYVSIVGYLVFAQTPDRNLMIGLVILIASGLFVVFDEARRVRKRAEG